MANLTEVRKKLTIVSVALTAVSVLAGLYVFLPVRASKDERVQELNTATLDHKRLEAEILPLRGLPEKLVKTRSDIAGFYQDRLPDNFSAFPEEIGKIAVKAGVRLADVKYESEDAEVPGLQLTVMDANLTGDYASVVRFINAVERNKVFFLIDRVTLAEEIGGLVKLQIRMESYMRPGTNQPAPAEKPVTRKSEKRT